jgi:hypothetical protein
MFEDSRLSLSLQRFADGGDGGSTGSAPAAAGQGEGGGEAAVAVAEGLAAAPSSAPLTEQQREEMFRALIKGEYKELYEREIRRLLQNRFRKTDGKLKRLEILDPLLDRLCTRYGVDPGDIEGLRRALDAEDAQAVKPRPAEGHSEAAEAAIIIEAQKSSYSEAAKAIPSKITKTTVMNKVHQFTFDMPSEEVETKKECRYLYIDADEDHISDNRPY